jgi:hypothetical protein
MHFARPTEVGRVTGGDPCLGAYLLPGANREVVPLWAMLMAVGAGTVGEVGARGRWMPRERLDVRSCSPRLFRKALAMPKSLKHSPRKCA